MGPAGSGKTYTALTIAKELGPRVAVLDTERGSASKYADRFGFDVVELDSYDPRRYVDVIEAADAAGYDVLIIDSLSHAWTGKGGALEMVDKVTARSKSRNSYTAWREVTPLHNQLVDAILGCSCHVLTTLRTKTEYVLEDNGRGGKVPRKIGMAPVQRDGLDYEFDVVGDMDWGHTLVVTKSRIPELSDAVIKEPGAKFAKTIARWVGVGVEESAAPVEVAPDAKALRALIGERMGAKTWAKEEVAALLATMKSKKVTDLKPAQVAKAWAALSNSTGAEWSQTQEVRK